MAVGLNAPPLLPLIAKSLPSCHITTGRHGTGIALRDRVRGVILFDFGGTLDADGARWSVRFYSAYLAAGGQEPFTMFEEAFRASDRALGRVAGIGTVGFRAMVDLQAALVLAHLPDGPALRRGADVGCIPSGLPPGGSPQPGAPPPPP